MRDFHPFSEIQKSAKKAFIRFFFTNIHFLSFLHFWGSSEGFRQNDDDFLVREGEGARVIAKMLF